MLCAQVWLLVQQEFPQRDWPAAEHAVVAVGVLLPGAVLPFGDGAGVVLVGSADVAVDALLLLEPRMFPFVPALLLPVLLPLLCVPSTAPRITAVVTRMLTAAAMIRWALETMLREPTAKTGAACSV